MSEVRVQPITYQVSALPEDDIDGDAWSITVEYRGEGMWAVCRWGQTMTKTGRWTHEPMPSSRGDGYLKAHRHDLDTALDLARKAAPKVVVNGMTPAQVLEWRAGRRAARTAAEASA